MKSFIKLITIIYLSLSGILYSCKKGDIPVVETSPITNVGANTAICGGTIITEGSGPIIARGVCWSAGANPTIKDLKTSDGAGSGTFTSNISGLTESIAYYVRAYATNKAGTGYGETKSFITLGQAPASTTKPATNITSTGATLNGTVNPNNISATVFFDYGTVANYGQTISPSPYVIHGNITTDISVVLSGLSPKTVYHYRIRSYNSLGTSFGNDVTFTTSSK
jgi:hypothetical protein